jgi:N utilization substance protein A
MRSQDLVSSFGEIARAKDIDRDTLQLIVEDVMRAMIRKRYGSDEAFEIIFNPEQGDIQILHIREVVPNMDLEDPVTEVELDEAKDFDPDFEVGDEVASELSIADFGRRAVMMGRQTFRQSIRDLEKEQIYEEYSKLVGEIIVGEIYQVRRHETLLMHEGTELVLPRNEQIPRDHYRKGNMLRTVVKEVKRDAGSDPQVVVSRTDPIFMERLFEIEVPEIYEGIVEIKEIARIPGDRAKVAVVSHDERVDPVGACVGVKGVRIHAVVRELANENIDVLQWSDNPHELIARALSPANPVDVKLNRDADPARARVEVVADEVSQAIGKGGVNIRLASQLTGFEIDVYREIPADEEDIDIEEFGDELEEDTIGKLKRIGCDTGKAVLELSVDELSRRAELDRDTAQRVLDIIETEFEEGPGIVQQLERGRFTVTAPQGGEDDPERSADVESTAEDVEEDELPADVTDAENGQAADEEPASVSGPGEEAAVASDTSTEEEKEIES